MRPTESEGVAEGEDEDEDGGVRSERSDVYKRQAIFIGVRPQRGGNMHGIALRYFVEVAQAGSLSGASERLHVAVSAISRQIAKLEEEEGAPLLERDARGMVPVSYTHLDVYKRKIMACIWPGSDCSSGATEPMRCV